MASLAAHPTTFLSDARLPILLLGPAAIDTYGRRGRRLTEREAEAWRGWAMETSEPAGWV